MTTVLPVEPLHWEQRAECRNHDPEMWWPVSVGGRGEDPSGTDQAAAAAAVAICYRRCPVQQQCLDKAIADGERWGIWGGLWPHQRAAYARDHRPRPEPAPEQVEEPHLSERDRLVARMRDAGLSAVIIGRYFGRDERTVYRWLRDIDKALAGAR